MSKWKIHNVDCLDFLRTLPDGSVDLTVTSPPYDKIRDYGNNWTLDLPEVGRLLYSATGDGGIAAMVIQDGTENGAKTGTTARTTCAWMDAGWRLWETCIYSKAGRPGAWWNKRFRVDHEFILVFVKGDRPSHFDKEPLKIPSKHAGKTVSGTQRRTDGGMDRISSHIQSDMKCRGTIWRYAASNTEGNEEKMLHPATFPDALALDLVRCFSAPESTVLDPFAGSGTTGVACIQTGRNFIGCEIDAGYAEIARRRCRDAEESVSLLAGAAQ